ncbi:hypothetical protein ISN45_Aa08g005800 [Arabidopsis thaliana x Arabidopsis arenosa]|uniref:Transmembrane protein n=1 Tax=Arabidopsis thaliana x Arabidopsis arenosa TaxID=1240361 RepID=A0A8T1XKW5_9BRAS|nr:hypothetical protein ISN45_Aa08g005800 [Arabidopsis thaliana x Arabidopsis arenosa]
MFWPFIAGVAVTLLLVTKHTLSLSVYSERSHCLMTPPSRRRHRHSGGRE